MSPLPLYEEALARVLELGDANPPSVEEVALDQARGRVLARELRSDRDLPPFNRAMMDGYALRAADFAPGKPIPVVADIPAGTSPDVAVPVGSCVKIATGAAVPRDLDTVIQHEVSDRMDPVSFCIDSVTKGQAIHPRGADAKFNDVVITGGTRLNPQHIGIAASVGMNLLESFVSPSVAIFTSGDEVRDPHEHVSDHQIRNSNGPMLSVAFTRFGGRVREHNHLRDDRDVTITSMREVIARLVPDVVITVGGVSAGERDHFPAAYDALSVEVAVSGARIQPGKPVQAGRMRDARTIVIGLPGNPVSALVCAHLFVWPLVRKLSGETPSLPWRTVTLSEPVKPNAHRQAFRPAVLLGDGDSIRVPQWAGSGDLVHTTSTHGFAALPMQRDTVPAGSRLRFLAWA